MILETIKAELIATMKDRDPNRKEANQEKLTTLRTLTAEIKTIEINERRTPTDEDVITILQRGIKQYRETLEKAGGQNSAGVVRTDIVQREEARIALYQSYLPTPFSEAELKALIDQAALETGAEGPKGMGAVMAWLKPKISGKADGKTVSALVKAKLAG
jgi:uncharacterized protein YqeY